MKALRPKLDVNRDDKSCEESALDEGFEGLESAVVELVVIIASDLYRDSSSLKPEQAREPGLGFLWTQLQALAVDTHIKFSTKFLQTFRNITNQYTYHGIEKKVSVHDPFEIDRAVEWRIRENFHDISLLLEFIIQMFRIPASMP
jgi:hypothetical protein